MACALVASIRANTKIDFYAQFGSNVFNSAFYSHTLCTEFGTKVVFANGKIEGQRVMLIQKWHENGRVIVQLTCWTIMTRGYGGTFDLNAALVLFL